MAIELANSGQKVLLLEGGATGYTDSSQNRYEGLMTALDWSKYKYMDGLRLRFLGGTSNHWVGYCLQLEESDLENWPISHSQLYQNAAAAEEILEIKSFANERNAIKKAEFSNSNSGMLHTLEPILRSKPVRFKEKYQDILGTHPNITLCTNANLLDINLSPSLNSVETIKVSADPKAKSVNLKINNLVLCMGAIECTRFLLLLQQKYPIKRNWNTSLVGKNFLEHPHFDWDDPIAYCISPKGSLAKAGLTSDLTFAEQQLTTAITPKPSTRSKLRTLNYAFTLFKADNFQIKENEIGYYSILKKIHGTSSGDHDIHIVNLQTEIDASPNNSIKLSKSSVDDFGIRRVELSVDFTPKLIHTISKATENLQRDLFKLNGLLIRTVSSPSFFMGGAHPMGTTRMGTNLENGVVNKDGNVFGVDNLYVCSASNFVSGGYANPTFTIVCMALNLAKKLIRS